MGLSCFKRLRQGNGLREHEESLLTRMPRRALHAARLAFLRTPSNGFAHRPKRPTAHMRAWAPLGL